MTAQRLEELLATLGANPWLQALLILLAAYAAARLAQLVLARLLPRLTRRTRTDLDDRIFSLLRRPVSTSILLLGLHLAVLRLEIRPPIDRYAAALAATLAILVWLAFTLRFTKLVLGALADRPDRVSFVHPQTVPVLENTATVLLLGSGAYFLLVTWGVPVSGWLASAGVAGLALGLAAKDTLANLFAGVAILADDAFSVGDFIILETGERGEITQIGIRSSRILTRDDLEIVIPNSVLADSKIINEAGGPARARRVRVKTQVAYGSDIDRARAILLEIAGSHPSVCDDPEPRVRFRAFEESGLFFELLAWVEEPVLRGRVIDALNCEVYKRFNAEGIEFPYPKRDLYLRETPDSKTALQG